MKPKTTIILSRAKTGKFWKMVRGNKTALFNNLYRAFQMAYGAIDDKGHITKIRIEVTREK